MCLKPELLCQTTGKNQAKPQTVCGHRLSCHLLQERRRAGFRKEALLASGGWTCAGGPGGPDRQCLIGTSHYNLSCDGAALPSVCVLVTQLCPTLCDPMDHSPPGSSVHWIFQARILEWVAIFFFKGSFQPRDGTRVSYIASRRFSVRVIREVLPRGWSGNSCHQSLAAACSKSRFLDDPIPTESISRRGPRNLNFEPIPAVILMHLEI